MTLWRRMIWPRRTALTDVSADIVPSLNENRILERWSGGVRLLQARVRSHGARLLYGLQFMRSLHDARLLRRS